MRDVKDGPASPRFKALPLKGNTTIKALRKKGISEIGISEIGISEIGISKQMAEVLDQAPEGSCVSWGIPFEIDRVVMLKDKPVCIELEPVRTEWLVFLHSSDMQPPEYNKHGFISASTGKGHLGEHAADYVVLYEDGQEERVAIRRRRHIGAFQRGWGENCFESVNHIKHRAVRAHHEQLHPVWGRSQVRTATADQGDWINWVYAWKNTCPDKSIVGLRLEPVSGLVILSSLACGQASSLPLRWIPRKKAILKLPESVEFDPELDESGLLEQIQLDLGQVISATPRFSYPNDRWEGSYNNKVPEVLTDEISIEYTAHPDAAFHLWDGQRVAVQTLRDAKTGRGAGDILRSVADASQEIIVRTVDKENGKPVAVKLHIHGQSGEYLAPMDRHRIPNPAWFEDYSVDFTHLETHYCSYIPGETRIKVPVGRIYVEVSKGFEIRPVRRIIEVTPGTKEITIEIEKILPWREKGWVSADTHVHFLSPTSAMLEGSGEGVNVVNLLASQWGELMTNVGDFDGKTTWGTKETGGEGEYLVRVGTENRQHVMGHISLLGYEGQMIVPMTTGGPNESALGDPIEVLLTEWARQCKKQKGLVILPHFPNPRAEHAASVVSGDVDGIEMTSWGKLYDGIDPYSLSDWYRYLNCGYTVAAVGGTDKMSAQTAVGTVRTYARTDPEEGFDYGAWMEAVRRGETFVTYGPLLEFTVEGKSMGSRISLGQTGGTVNVHWEVASVTVPVTKVELVVNGEICESSDTNGETASGQWSVKVDRSSWLALLVRGHYSDKPEIIVAHSSPVMVEVEKSEFYAAADAVTILEQIEGAMAYLDTVGTKAEKEAYKRMRLVLESVHRTMHNRMHQMGHFHEHSPVDDHPEHH